MVKKKEKKTEKLKETTDVVIQEPVKNTEETAVNQEEKPEEFLVTETINETQKLETFKGQLVQALSLNDKLISEVKSRDKEITTFQEIKTSLEHVIDDQNKTISHLKEELVIFKSEKLKEKIEILAKKWVKRYNIPDEKIEDVFKMLSKYTTEKELLEFEMIIDNSRKDKPSPVPATQSSAVLVETFADKSASVELLSPEEQRDKLFSQMKQVDELQNKGDLI